MQMERVNVSFKILPGYFPTSFFNNIQLNFFKLVTKNTHFLPPPN